jgi:biopolymer transport protein ExbD
MNLRKRFRGKPEVHTGALNDILFILLLFFLIVSTLANPNVIKVSNPKSSRDDVKTQQTVVVSINNDQQVFVGNTPVQLDSLSNNSLAKELKLALDKEKKENPTVVINGDSVAKLGVTIQVMQIIKKLGATPVVAVDPH